MANSKISELTASAGIGGSEQIPVNDAGTNKRVTPAQILDYVKGTASTWTAIQDFTAGLTGGADSTTPSTDATITLDGKAKVVAPGAAITLSFSTPSGVTAASAPIMIKQGATPYAITLGSSATVLGTAPTMAANTAYLFGAFTFDGGTSYYVQVGQAGS